MGVSDILKPKTFLKLSDGNEVSFANWADREPNNDRGREHCAEWRDGGKWNDIMCDNKNTFICELD
jgi:hypothetical protein